MRKKVRKSLAFLLALALVVSVMSGLGLSVSAEDEAITSTPVVTEEVEGQSQQEGNKEEGKTEGTEGETTTEPTQEEPTEEETKKEETQESDENAEEANGGEEESAEDSEEETVVKQALPKAFAVRSNVVGSTGSDTQNLTHEKYVTKNDDGTYDLSLTVKGAKGSESNPVPVNVLLILDRSRSMAQYIDGKTTRLAKVQEVATSLVNNLSTYANLNVQYGLVSFNKSGSCDLNWTGETSTVIAKIKDETMSTGTNYQAGIYQAKQLLTSQRAGAQTYVIFLTDGEPNYYGTTSPESTQYASTAIYHAKSELANMTGTAFYCIGVLDSMTNLNQLVTGATGFKTAQAMQANSASALETVFKEIEAQITEFRCSNVTVTDVLSENVEVVTTGTGTDTAPKKLHITVRNDTTEKVVVQGENSVTVDGNTITARYDSDEKTITLDFPDDYELNPDYTFIVTTTIQATEKAYENVRTNKGDYPNTGDAGTGDTASQKGVYSNVNESATVTYTYKGIEQTELYAKPVIRLTPAKLVVKKTITGLEDLTEEQIKKLEEAMTFTITYTYPTGTDTPVTETETKKLSDFTKNADGTYTYTSGDIWSMGATYAVTESDFNVEGYDCVVSSSETQKDSIPKGDTATAEFTNAYTPSDRTITLKKVVTGNMGDTKKEFTFSVSEGATIAVTTLADGETTTITAKVGTTVTITEEDYTSDGYTTTASATDGVNGEYKNHSFTFTVTKDMGESTVITFTNDKTINPPSGVTTNAAPYIVMVVLAAGAAVYFVYSRRRRNG